MSTSKLSSLNIRAITSLSMLFSFACLPPSGIILHLTDGASISVLRHASMSIHNAAGIMFLLAAILHIVYNAKVIKKYVVVKSSMLPSLKREAIIAFFISIGTVLLFTSHVFLVH